MGRKETVTYECDWCHASSPPDRGYSESIPSGWDEPEGELLCVTCLDVRRGALIRAKNRCSKGVVSIVDEAVGKAAKEHVGHDDCGE